MCGREAIQGFELAGLYTLVAIAAIALRHRIPDLDRAPLALRLAVGVTVGAIVAVPIAIGGGMDLIPDRLEPVFLAGALLGLGVVVVWLRR